MLMKVFATCRKTINIKNDDIRSFVQIVRLIYPFVWLCLYHKLFEFEALVSNILIVQKVFDRFFQCFLCFDLYIMTRKQEISLLIYTLNLFLWSYEHISVLLEHSESMFYFYPPF